MKMKIYNNCIELHPLPLFVLCLIECAKKKPEALCFISDYAQLVYSIPVPAKVASVAAFYSNRIKRLIKENYSYCSSLKQKVREL